MTIALRWGALMRARRRELGLRPEQVAEALGRTRATIYRWEAGGSTPSDEDKVRIAEVLRVPDPRQLFPLEVQV